MIVGIGVDILEIEHLKKIIDFQKDGFLHYVFTDNEIKYYNNKRGLEHLATTFTAKEAFFKAVNQITSTICLKEIEISRNKAGAPQINLSGTFAQKFPKNQFHFYLSSSFDSQFAISFVVAEQF
jgi:holo-[acyl-carrier protein] synthase